MIRKILFTLSIALIISIVSNATITTPYPTTIELKQINSAEKERIRLCQGHKKYDRQPTGFYVSAGKKVEVEVEILTAAELDVMPVLTVGTMGFNVDGRNTGIRTTLKAGINTIDASTGGLVWLDFLQDGGSEPKGLAKITFTANSEHVRAPHYIFGVTTDAEFTEMMQAYQTPDVLYHSDYAVIVATSEAAQQYSVSEKKDDWMISLHDLLAQEDGISGMDNNDPNPLHHRLKAGEVRFLLTENTSSSPHANSTGYTGYPHGSRLRYLTKLGTASNNSWMLGHELGHQHQQPAYQINQSTESTVNIYSYVVERSIQGASYNRTVAARWTQAQNSYLKLFFSKRIYDMPDSELEAVTGFNRDELRFMVWEQLFLIFGDDFYKRLHRVVREEKITGGGADDRRAYLIWKASQVSGYDLTDYFNRWGIRVSEEQVKAKLRAKMGNALKKGDIVPLPESAEECTMITGQNPPAWIPLPLKGITSSSPENAVTPIDRSDWTVTVSVENGIPDATVGGDNVRYMIDNNTTTAFSFIKPGKTYEGVTGADDYIPSFTVDMKTEKSFNYVSYMHRTAGGNSSEYIRARQLTIFGSNDNSTFTPVVEHYPIDYVKNENEITINFPAVSYRYIKVTIEDWNETNGSSIQVAEFNAGTKAPEEQLPVPEPLKFQVNVKTSEGIVTSQAGIQYENEDSDYTVDFTIMPNLKDLKVAVDGEQVQPAVSDGKYSLTVKVTNHIDITVSGRLDTGMESPSGNNQLTVYPSPVKAGQPFRIVPGEKFQDAATGIYSIYTVSGVKISEQKTGGNFVEQSIDRPGTYIIEVKKNTGKQVSKIIVQ
ncbi:MAG: M60 family metallopeptidase [Dysgonamonadaceae bacterium]|jgi:hypothetical protein|nr:M60 family metallopeptidase [Dysgonamonadaceae bacterium]